MKTLVALFALLWTFACDAQTTWDGAHESNITLSNGNLTATTTATSTIAGVRATTSKSTGKWYFEVTTNIPGGVGSNYSVGVGSSAWTVTNQPGIFDSVSAGYRATGTLLANSTGTALSASGYFLGQVIGVAVDVPNHLIYWSLNGTFQNSAVPSSGAGGVDYITTNPVFPILYIPSQGSATAGTLNTGATAFTTAPPSGFTAWDTSTGAVTPFLFMPNIIP